MHPLWTFESYVSGLKEEIRSEVKLFRPTTLLHATSLAQLQEDKLQRMRHAIFTPTLAKFSQPQPSPYNPSLLPTPTPVKPTLPPTTGM